MINIIGNRMRRTYVSVSAITDQVVTLLKPSWDNDLSRYESEGQNIKLLLQIHLVCGEKKYKCRSY